MRAQTIGPVLSAAVLVLSAAPAFAYDANHPRDTIAFVDDGSTPFDTTDQGECRVRMQCIGALLMVEDNSGCGGAGVSFTGLYHRKEQRAEALQRRES